MLCMKSIKRKTVLQNKVFVCDLGKKLASEISKCNKCNFALEKRDENEPRFMHSWQAGAAP